MSAFEDKLKEFSELIEKTGQPEEVQSMAREIKEMCETDADWEQLDAYMKERVTMLVEDIAELREEAIKHQLADVSEMINLSYIAKKYFHRSRAWLSQRINGNKVNGKVCRFTESEIATLNAALQDMSAQLSVVRITY